MARKLIPIFLGTTGLNIKADPVRLQRTKEGLVELAEAVNIDVDRNYRPSRRKGQQPTARTEPGHSLWAEGDLCLYVSQGTLYRLFADLSRKQLTANLQDLPMSYCKVGPLCFFANGYDKGIIYQDAVYPWTRAGLASIAGHDGSYVGPDTTRSFSDPPPGELLEIWNGRMWVSTDEIVWASEPFAYAMFDLSRAFLPFEAKVTMLKGVRQGLFVGTLEGTYFLRGSVPGDMMIEQVSTGKVIRGTVQRLDLTNTGLLKDVSGTGVIWTEDKGLMVGTMDGQVINLTKSTIDMPQALTGASTIYDDGNSDRYITTFT